MVKLVLMLAAAVLGLFAVRTVVTGALEFRRAKRGELVRIERGRRPVWFWIFVLGITGCAVGLGWLALGV